MGFRSFWKGGTSSLLPSREEMSMSQNFPASQRAGSAAVTLRRWPGWSQEAQALARGLDGEVRG